MHTVCVHAAKDAALKEKLISSCFERRKAQGRLTQDWRRWLFRSLSCFPLQSRRLQSDTDCLMWREQIIHEKQLLSRVAARAE